VQRFDNIAGASCREALVLMGWVRQRVYGVVSRPVREDSFLVRKMSYVTPVLCRLQLCDRFDVVVARSRKPRIKDDGDGGIEQSGWLNEESALQILGLCLANLYPTAPARSGNG
jgi:hypothetical protein